MSGGLSFGMAGNGRIKQEVGKTTWGYFPSKRFKLCQIEEFEWVVESEKDWW